MSPLEPFRCSVESESRAEPMLGTASTVRSWLLVEHPGPWGGDALADGRLPDGLGRRLGSLGRELGVRVVLIRRPKRVAGAGVSCFAIRSGPEHPWVERSVLDRIEDVASLDLLSLGAGRRPGLEPFAHPLFLVCTHGRRDPCCAERGRPLAHAVGGAFRDETWESSHIGGDRFAGNLIAFPHGLYFGRVATARGPLVARAYTEGRIDLAQYRGRSCYPMDVQAAEQFLRTEHLLEGVDEVQPESVERSRTETTVAFSTWDGVLAVRLGRGRAEPRRLTCHAAEAQAPLTYRLLEITERP